ncbi:hypothetical protein Mal4_25080 [Maioricimonas rarisocia]|uniref:Uncharacterized protein n=1 Tax=Maioricimonas rarisocia TaxID=2528026 RepID=A0A517Z6W7_9PLAN|nr:hypothetical protein Mal4_25080 [Maioricimonas rarisocia]
MIVILRSGAGRSGDCSNRHADATEDFCLDLSIGDVGSPTGHSSTVSLLPMTS